MEKKYFGSYIKSSVFSKKSLVLINIEILAEVPGVARDKK
jgi:hypothetical protein